MLLGTVVGCAGAEEAAPCRPGFFPGPEGHCWPPPPDPEPPTAADVIEGLPGCVPHKPTGEIDLDGGCVEGACAGDTWLAVSAALGEGWSCADASWSSEWRYCHWDGRIQGLFPDEDQDDVPDPDGRTDWLRLYGGYRGATTDGVGVDQSVRCWTDRLGVPTAATWVDHAGVLGLEELYWDGYGVYLYDTSSPAGGGTPDGVVDDAYLFGAP